MTNPRRLIDEGLDDFERNLLAAGRRDSMPQGSRLRIMAGLGLGALVPGTAVAAGAKGAAKGTLFGLASATGVKVAVGGAVGAIAIWSSVALVDRSGPSGSEVTPPAAVHVEQMPRAERAPAPIEEQVQAPTETPTLDDGAEEAELPNEAEAIEEREERAVGSRAHGPSKSTATDDLGRELASLDRARSALRSGDAAGCLRLLGEHSRKFPKQRMAVEASVLRIEALSASGNAAAAGRAGRVFLAKHPKGPYAQRVRSLIGAERDGVDGNQHE